MEYVGWKPVTIAHRYLVRRYNINRGRAGVEAFSRKGVHKVGHPAAVRAVCTSIHSAPKRQSRPNPLEVKVEVWVS